MYNFDVLKKIFESYNLSKSDQIEIYDTIKDIFLHDEFQRRLGKEFLHHGDTTLGEHILKDTTLTYILSKRLKNNENYNIKYALTIAMLHDLYTKPWQNSGIIKEKQYHRHGFLHPIEAAINSATWFEDVFEGDKGEVIMDGIVHHMYPLPVTVYYDNENNDLELLNYEESRKLPNRIKEMLVKSTSRGKIGPVSLTPSKYKEGRVMSVADKISSITGKEIRNIGDLTALYTGNNPNLEERKTIKR